MKINFIVSNVYNSIFNSDKDISKFKSNIEEFADEYLVEVIEFIEKETKVSFKRKEYDCFLVDKFPVKGISSPLTVRVSNETFLDFITLIHELIHILMVENRDKFTKLAYSLDLENNKVFSHVIIFDLINKINAKFFDNRDLGKNMEVYPESHQFLEKIKRIDYDIK